jgi:hypothetical protein
MNFKWITTIVATAALGLFAPVVAFAGQGTRIEANVPFSFTAGDESFPAGHYVFIVDDPMQLSELTIQADNGRKVEVLMSDAEAHSGAFNESKVIFDQYGKDHFLSKVLVAGFDEARVLPRSEIQREYARLLEQREVPARAVGIAH